MWAIRVVVTFASEPFCFYFDDKTTLETAKQRFLTALQTRHPKYSNTNLEASMIMFTNSKNEAIPEGLISHLFTNRNVYIWASLSERYNGQQMSNTSNAKSKSKASSKKPIKKPFLKKAADQPVQNNKSNIDNNNNNAPTTQIPTEETKPSLTWNEFLSTSQQFELEAKKKKVDLIDESSFHPIKDSPSLHEDQAHQQSDSKQDEPHKKKFLFF